MFLASGEKMWISLAFYAINHHRKQPAKKHAAIPVTIFDR
jgi:hypothetical protein